jgi:hypothetical protein
MVVVRAFGQRVDASSPSRFSISQGTIFWNSSVSKMMLNCEIGCGPIGSSQNAPGLTANRLMIASRRRSAVGRVARS